MQDVTTNGDFTLRTIPVGLTPIAVAATSKVNGVAVAPDLAVSNNDDNTVTYLKNSGAGQFTATTLNAGCGPSTLFFADLHDNLKLTSPTDGDLVVVNTALASCTGDNITVWLNAGSSSPVRTDYTLPNVAPIVQVSALDMNGDGYLDLVVTMLTVNQVVVLLNDGTGNFTNTAVTNLTRVPNQFVSGDFNGDGFADLALTAPGNSSVVVLLGDGTGLFRSVQDLGVDATPGAIAAADLNGDGNPDLVALSHGVSGANFLQGNGAGSFFPFFNTPIPMNSNPQFMVLGRFSAGPYPGMAAVHPGFSDTSVFHNESTPSVFSAIEVIVSTPDDPQGIAEGHFANTATLDLVVPERHRRLIYVLKGDGTGNFSVSQIALTVQTQAPLTFKLTGPGEVYDDVALVEPLDGTLLLLQNTHN
ncbi:MAG TPA: VCBS repeat-containing protein [bacterium]|nr:VCBS repeat-containing protein [bacterium]